MILPEDTKPPLDDDEESVYDDNGRTGQYGGYRDEDAYTAYTLEYPLSPQSTSLPLLEDDIELGPAPPYSAEAPEYPFSFRRRTPSQKKRSTWRRNLAYGLGGLAWTILIVVLMRSLGRQRGSRRFWRPRPPPNEAVFDLGENADGVAVGCATYTAGDTWIPFPATGDTPYLPSPLLGGSSQWSTNSTFLMSTHIPGDLFAHLAGEVAIGDFFVETYDAKDKALYERDLKEAIIGKTPEGKIPQQGEYLRMQVEPIITTSQNESLTDSFGMRSLQVSRICLMDRKPNGTSWFAADTGGRDRGDQKPGMGVGLYTSNAVDQPESRETPLQFRIHVFLPAARTSEGVRASKQGLLQSLIGGRPPFSGRHVQSLDLRGGASGVYFGNVSRASLGEINVNTAVGDILVDSMRAQTIRMRTTGSIRGNIAVSDNLDVDTPVGNVDLNLTLASHVLPDQQGPRIALNRTGEIDCHLPPVQVSVGAASGSTRVAYVGWEEECRGLSQDIHSLMGSVEVVSHPLFQGPFRLSTTLGDIAVETSESALDPLGKGRKRTISVQKKETIASKAWDGSVRWVAAESGEGAADSEQSPAYESRDRGRRRKEGVNVRTSVGNVRVVF